MNIKIRGKMIYSHILIALIPFCLVGMLGVIISTREAEKNVTQHTTQMVGQVCQTVDVYISSIEKIANMLIQTMEPMGIDDFWFDGDDRWRECQEELTSNFQAVAQTHNCLLYTSFPSRMPRIT